MITIVINKYGLVGAKFLQIIKITSNINTITTKIFKKNMQPLFNRKSETSVSGVGGSKKTGYHTGQLKKMPVELVPLLCDVVVRYQAQVTVNLLELALLIC